MRQSRRGPWIVGCAVLAAAVPLAQTFKTGVTAVVLDVVVTDGRGEPIRDLVKDDFDVIEDGQTRAVLSATLVSVPIGDDRERIRPRDIWTNLALRERRIFTIVIDDLDIDPRDAPRAKDVVRRFIARLPDGDLAAVVYCGQQTGAQEFTADKTRLFASVDRFTGKRPGDVGGFGDDANVVDTASAERNANFLRVFATIQNVVEWLVGVEGRRKAVVLVTGAVPSVFTDLSSDSRIAEGLRRIATAAMRANVAIYPIDARGLAAPDDTATETTVLAALAHETGGVLTVNTNNLARGFDTVIRDSSDYYLIGFTPGEEPKQKATPLHRVVVRARRRAAVVRSRQAYVTGIAATNKATSQTAIAKVLGSPLPGGRLPLEVQAAWFADVKGWGHVFAITEIAGEAVRFDVRDAQQMAVLDYRVAATDASGRILARDSRRLDFRLSDLRRDQVSRGSVRLISALDLKPGRYRLRAAVVDERRREHGVLAGDLEVPDVAKAPIVMSGVLLTSTAVHTPVFRGDVKAFEDRLPMPPTTARTFARADGVEVYAEVYTREGVQPVEINASIYDLEGRRIREERPKPGARRAGLAGRPCLVIRLPLDVASLPVGGFLLELSGRVADSRVSKQLVFDIR